MASCEGPPRILTTALHETLGFVNVSDKDEDFSMRLFLISSRIDNTWIIQFTFV
jgi:hypothetical protein